MLMNWLFSLLLTVFTFVELNCENLFDCTPDSVADDKEWTPEGGKRWGARRYWTKLDGLGRTILSCGDDSCGWMLPDMVALCEVENDTVMRDLARRSLLRQAGYDYVVTQSADARGIDVALLYSPYSFLLLDTASIRVEMPGERRSTRDILYVSGRITTGDTLHVFVVHAPSRFGGKNASSPYRLAVAGRLMAVIDSIRHRQPDAPILVAGDFNDEPDDASCRYYTDRQLVDVSQEAEGAANVTGTYKFKGYWERIDHIFASQKMAQWLEGCRIHCPAFLLEEDMEYGGVMPFRTYKGYRYNRGYSDHLPLVARFSLPDDAPVASR